MDDASLVRLDHLHEVATTLLTDDVIEWQRREAEHSHRTARLEEAFAQAIAELEDSSQLLEHAHRARSRWYYKAVAKVDGRYLSIFDGRTEFKLGVRIARRPALGHRGAFFVHDTLEAARAALNSFPKGSKLLKAQKALLRVSGDVPHTEARRVHGKVMLWALVPLEEVPIDPLSRRRRTAPLTRREFMRQTFCTV
mmetsp:Transcript_21889/g.66453  ORF Transcript_21889/g.66453 Transcript_21889/m.66453 type:complete len:196 (+) Transcript_21889:26-613(+)